MNKSLLAILGVLIIGAGVYDFVVYAPQRALSPVDTAGSSEASTTVKKVSINEDTDVYHIEVQYPQTGIPSVDAPVKNMVEQALSEFRSYPANPPDSAVPKNDFLGSFSSVYTGPDVASVSLTFSEYTGGAHPNTNIFGVNVDLKTGKELTLDDADRKSTRLNSSHLKLSRMPSSA